MLLLNYYINRIEYGGHNEKKNWKSLSKCLEKFPDVESVEISNIEWWSRVTFI